MCIWRLKEELFSEIVAAFLGQQISVWNHFQFEGEYWYIFIIVIYLLYLALLCITCKIPRIMGSNGIFSDFPLIWFPRWLDCTLLLHHKYISIKSMTQSTWLTQAGQPKNKPSSWSTIQQEMVHIIEIHLHRCKLAQKKNRTGKKVVLYGIVYRYTCTDWICRNRKKNALIILMSTPFIPITMMQKRSNDGQKAQVKKVII